MFTSILNFFSSRAYSHEMAQDLIQHLNSCHGHGLKIETVTLDNWEEFVSWKESKEKMGKSWFVKQQGDRRAKYHKTSWFYCNRTGEWESKGK